jgi:hypothetical protein
MGLRLPLLAVLDTTVTDVGTASVNGGLAFPFKIPQDTDNVVVKLTASVVSGGVSATFQTTDDGGTTWYDVSRTSIVSSNGVAGTGLGGTAKAEWLVIPTIGGEARNIVTASLIATGSLVAGVYNGNAGASTLAAGQNSGLPILGLANRIFVIETGTISSNNSRVQVLVNQQNRA